MHGQAKSATAGDLSFPHSWQAAVVETQPLISPASLRPMRHFIYPQEVEEVERGALELFVHSSAPAGENNQPQGVSFRATFALGFADPAVATGVWACPHPDWLCAVAGGYAYLVDTTDPDRWEQVNHRPVLEITALPSVGLLLFSGHHSLIAYDAKGKAWQSARLSSEGFKILDIAEETLTGRGWDLLTDREFEFKVDLRTGEHRLLHPPQSPPATRRN